MGNIPDDELLLPGSRYHHTDEYLIKRLLNKYGNTTADDISRELESLNGPRSRSIGNSFFCYRRVGSIDDYFICPRRVSAAKALLKAKRDWEARCMENDARMRKIEYECWEAHCEEKEVYKGKDTGREHGDSKPYIDWKAFFGEGKQAYTVREDEYWKASGEDKVVYKGKDGLVGMRKTFVYNPPDRNLKEEWVMHEYRLEGKLPLPHTSKNEWVLCKVFRNTATVPVKNDAPLKGCAKPVRSPWAPAGRWVF